MNGYLHPDYAESLAEFGTPHELPRCGGWILKRWIPGFSYLDGMGCYPLFVCRNWYQLYDDLEDLKDKLVSLAIVTDPFGDYDTFLLQQCFDRVIRYKEHFVIELDRPIDQIASKHHRYYSRRALKTVSVEECSNPINFLEEWMDLYNTLVRRHNLTGIKAFSRTAFAKQLSIPGTIMFRAVHQGQTIGAHLWYVQGKIGYSHLEAISPIGYKLMASYALYWFAIESFINKLRSLDLGAGAGTVNQCADGLSQFKVGWSTNTLPVYFCGRIFDKARYSEIATAKGIYATDYFPAYRDREFG